MSTYKKTAKDIAFDKERTQLKAEINKLSAELRLFNRNKEMEIKEKDQIIADLLKKNQALENSISIWSDGKITPEELIKHMELVKRLDSYRAMFEKYSTLVLPFC